MKEIKFDRLGFALNVDANAAYETNAEELYRAALIGADKSRSKFQQIYGVKDRVKLGLVEAASMVKPGACDFDPSDIDISQITLTVCPIMIGTAFCVEDLESSFLSDQIGKGSSDFKQPAAFMNFLYETVANKVDEELELITWQGVSSTGATYIDSCDGLEYKLSIDPTVLSAATASTVTSANVIDKLIEARNAMGVAVRRKSDFTYMVSQNVYDALADAVSTNKASGLYYVENVELKFQGVSVTLADGMSDDVIVAGSLSNFVYATDLLADTQSFNFVDFMKTTLVRKIGLRTDAKINFSYKIGAEIYFHKP